VPLSLLLLLLLLHLRRRGKQLLLPFSAITAT